MTQEQDNGRITIAPEKADAFDAVEVAARNLVESARIQRQALKDFSDYLDQKKLNLHRIEVDLNAREVDVKRREASVKDIVESRTRQMNDYKQQALVQKGIADEAYKKRQQAEADARTAREERERMEATLDMLRADKVRLQKQIDELSEPATSPVMTEPMPQSTT